MFHFNIIDLTADDHRAGPPDQGRPASRLTAVGNEGHDRLAQKIVRRQERPHRRGKRPAPDWKAEENRLVSGNVSDALHQRRAGRRIALQPRPFDRFLVVLGVSIAAPDVVSRAPQGRRGVFLSNKPDTARLATIAQQVAADTLQSTIAEVVGVDDLPSAIERNRTGHAPGKIVADFTR